MWALGSLRAVSEGDLGWTDAIRMLEGLLKRNPFRNILEGMFELLGSELGVGYWLSE
jgi:hypothetical protein